MDLTKGKVNEFKNETKLDNAEKELYVKGSKTNELVSHQTDKTDCVILRDRKCISVFQMAIRKRVYDTNSRHGIESSKT